MMPVPPKPSNSYVQATTTLDKLIDVWKELPSLFRQYQNVILLRAALDHPPTEEGRRSLAIAVNSCLEDPWRLQRLGWELFTDLICTMMALNIRMNAFTSDYSRDAKMWHTASTNELLRADSTDSNKIWRLCTRRGGNHCEASGASVSDISLHSERSSFALTQPCDRTYRTTTIHIIPPLLNDGKFESHVKHKSENHRLWPSFATRKTKSSQPPSRNRTVIDKFWRQTKLFIGHELSEELEGARITGLRNSFVVNVNLSILFASFAVWFEHISDNTYRFSTIPDIPLPSSLGLRDGQLITFNTSDPVLLPVPNPLYLGLHASCARIVHFSGSDAASQLLMFKLDLNEVCLDNATTDPLRSASFELLEKALKRFDDRVWQKNGKSMIQRPISPDSRPS